MYVPSWLPWGIIYGLPLPKRHGLYIRVAMDQNQIISGNFDILLNYERNKSTSQTLINNLTKCKSVWG